MLSMTKKSITLQTFWCVFHVIADVFSPNPNPTWIKISSTRVSSKNSRDGWTHLMKRKSYFGTAIAFNRYYQTWIRLMRTDRTTQSQHIRDSCDNYSWHSSWHWPSLQSSSISYPWTKLIHFWTLKGHSSLREQVSIYFYLKTLQPGCRENRQTPQKVGTAWKQAGRSVQKNLTRL